MRVHVLPLARLWVRSPLDRLAKSARHKGTNDPLVLTLETRILDVGLRDHFQDIGTTSKILYP